MNTRENVANEHGEKPYSSYKSYVQARTKRNSSLQNLLDFLSSDDSRQRTCRIACIEFSSLSGIAIRKCLDLNTLKLLLTDRTNGIQGRLLIVEDLHPDIVETLGSILNLDPFFFASHIDLYKFDISRKRPCMTVSLPSRLKSQDFLTLRYHRVFDFKHSLPRQSLRRDMNVSRKVMMIPSSKGSNLGLARHGCSILRVSGDDGFWLGKSIVHP